MVRLTISEFKELVKLVAEELDKSNEVKPVCKDTISFDKAKFEEKIEEICTFLMTNIQVQVKDHGKISDVCAQLNYLKQGVLFD